MRKEELKKNLQLCKLVERHPCLWKYTIPEYGKKEVTEAVWRNIAKQMNESEQDCRERWRMIRNSFVKSRLANCISKIKARKEYYLAKDLSFLIPYTRKRTITNKNEDQVEIVQEDQEETNSSINIDREGYDKNITNIKKQEKIISTPAASPLPLPSSPQLEENVISENEENFEKTETKNSWTEVENAISHWLNTKKEKKLKRKRLSLVEDSDEHFAKSLVKYMKRMSDGQNLQFRRKVTALMEDILTDNGNN